MVEVSQTLVERLTIEKRLSPDEMSLSLTAAVSAEIVGLDGMTKLGFGRRLSRFFNVEQRGTSPISIAAYVLQDLALHRIHSLGASFRFLD